MIFLMIGIKTKQAFTHKLQQQAQIKKTQLILICCFNLKI
ncbi:hypothetical protein CMPG5300_3242 (plasmid) [Lactiplantibacillus plantarum CMPG5300]|nr:hypothetical protein CMPG5300_3242 [Lactiplantibacillus plantarum CMPG5300]